MAKISKRQLEILEFLRKKGPKGNQAIREYIENIFGEIARVTIVRDLGVLLNAGLIKKQGQGRSVKYYEAVQNKLLTYFDLNEYFKLGPDERKVSCPLFNFEIFKDLNNLFTEPEIKELTGINNSYQKKIKQLSKTALKKEFERLTIELSWKSSRIEGNTYSLIDTEILIKENKEAVGHSKEEAIMILNHKLAFDYILDKKSNFKQISIAKIENIHKMLINKLNVASGLRKTKVGIIGTSYRPLGNQHQIREAMEKLVKKINALKNPYSKALNLILMLSYIQPFEDGNKRTARLLGNAVLLAHDICPLSYRSVNESDYKKAVILFYEQNNASAFKELFIQQYKFSIENYF